MNKSSEFGFELGHVKTNEAKKDEISNRLKLVTFDIQRALVTSVDSPSTPTHRQLLHLSNVMQLEDLNFASYKRT